MSPVQREDLGQQLLELLFSGGHPPTLFPVSRTLLHSPVDKSVLSLGLAATEQLEGRELRRLREHDGATGLAFEGLGQLVDQALHRQRLFGLLNQTQIGPCHGSLLLPRITVQAFLCSPCSGG